MLEILQYIFSSFWVWLGFTILVHYVVVGIAAIAAAIGSKEKKE